MSLTTKILDSDLSSNQFMDIVEEYIHAKREPTSIESKYFNIKLTKLGFSKDQIRELIIEMDNDANKELLAGIGVKKAKLKLVLGLTFGLLGIVLSYMAVFTPYYGRSLSFFFLPFGIIATSFIIAGKAFVEVGLVKKRKKRRLLKYRKWN